MTSQQVISKPVRKRSNKTHAEVVASIKQDQLNRARGLIGVMSEIVNDRTDRALDRYEDK